MAQAGVEHLTVNMKYIIAQEKNNYGAWQCTVAVSSLIELGVPQEDIFVLLGDYGYNRDWNDFKTRFGKVNIYETRNHSIQRYKPAIKPYLLWHFFKTFEYLEKEQWMLIDNDVIITQLLSKKKKGTIHVSDCSSYLNLDYLERKGVGLAEEMAKCVSVQYSKVLEMDKGAGGAQYVFDNVNWKTWRKAYLNSIKLFDFLNGNKNNFKRKDSENCVQVWCAEMWGVLWSLWDDGHVTKISGDMMFLFATDAAELGDQYKIIHNAGVTSEDSELFNKGDFLKRSPKNHEQYVDDSKVSYLYYNYLKKVL